MIDSTTRFVKRQAQRMRELSAAAARVIRPVAMLLAAAAAVSAQQTADEVVQPSTSLASQFFEHDFVNVFAFADGIYDTSLPQITSNSSREGGAFGLSAGGGITAGHNFKDGVFSLSYKGDYRHYFGNSYSNGTDQNLSILYSKRLNRRWSMGLQGGGGVVSYGGQFYGSSVGIGSPVLTNPLSSQSRFANAGVSLTYSQTRRLSYTFSGQFFLSNYNYAGAINSTGGTGTASVDYRLTARTTLGGSYGYSYFSYAGSLGSSTIENGYLTLSHQFADHWTTSLSAGVSHSHSQGTITEPVLLLLGQQLVSGFVTGPYDRSNNSPSFQVTVGRSMRRSMFSVSGGQGINAGNGTFLTSRSQFVGATYSITRRLTNLSFGASYNRLSSIANTVNTTYSTANASASYGFNIVRYVSANLRFDFIHYDNLYQLQGINENRFTFGLTFSSKSIPLTLF